MVSAILLLAGLCALERVKENPSPNRDLARRWPGDGKKGAGICSAGFSSAMNRHETLKGQKGTVILSFRSAIGDLLQRAALCAPAGRRDLSSRD